MHRLVTMTMTLLYDHDKNVHIPAGITRIGSLGRLVTLLVGAKRVIFVLGSFAAAR